MADNPLYGGLPYGPDNLLMVDDYGRPLPDITTPSPAFNPAGLARLHQMQQDISPPPRPYASGGDSPPPDAPSPFLHPLAWLQAQREESYAAGRLDPATGLPTSKGWLQGLSTLPNALLMGTTAPGEVAPFPLEPKRNPDAPGFNDRISTTLPRSADVLDANKQPLAHSDTGGDAQDIGLDKIIGTSAEGKAAAKLQSYPDVPTPDPSAGNMSTFQAAVSHMKDNLRWIYDNMDPAVRAIAQKWYDGANSMTADLAQQFDLSHRAVAGLVARLSPSTDWYQNMSMAKRILNIRSTQGDTAMAPEQQTLIDQYIGGMKDDDIADAFRKENAGMYNADGTPKTYNQLTTNTQKAMFIRSHDEATWAVDPRNRDYAMIHPEGRELGPATLDDSVTPAGLTWQSFGNISKGLDILDDDSLANISGSLGDGHKIRSFYNNIISPNAGHDITVDTHQIAASHLLPLGAGDPVVTTGMRGAPQAVSTGSGGLYGVYAEATRQLANDLNLLPREAQSITWEGLRSLYPRGLKLSKPFVRDMRGIMDNAADPEAARAAVAAHPRSGFDPKTGYIQRPDWFGQ